VAANNYMIVGKDDALLSQALHSLIDSLLGGDPFHLTVEDFSAKEEFDVSQVITSLKTPPFLTNKRILIVRDAQKLDAEQVDRICEYISNPAPESYLILVASGNASPVLLNKIKEQAILLNADPPSPRSRSEWLLAKLKENGLKLDAKAANVLLEHVGQDLSRLEPIIEVLKNAYLDKAALSIGDIMPFLGTQGDVLPWEFTDAIDAGDSNRALVCLHRMLRSSNRYHLQILASLHSRYRMCLALDQSSIQDEESAAKYLGVHPYVAKKALKMTLILGTNNILRITELLGDADLNLRGVTGLLPMSTLEILVARLCQISRMSKASAGGRRR
jgi:DNA polymerase-3 subunit delta